MNVDEQDVREGREEQAGQRVQIPPLMSIGLQLHRDASWTHEGAPILNRKLREKFDRSVRFLPEERSYVVEVGRFRAQVDVEEAGFFVRSVDVPAGTVALSDQTTDRLELESLRLSPLDGAWLCTVKRDLVAEGVPARFMHNAQAELLNAVEERAEGPGVEIRGEWWALPEL